ncbi:hypothetical protein F0562_027530 [Nyssa sinensis]|uniref:Deubiquitinating enzyme MINDY-3/4 conserved domain-containing protein n=1 Tax=Nyssa sinensis TaxID=561372 RepID=A0A5J5B5K7_9ASTE|nr:hypothetical protein F0562_027530 [Nyssa sinensis]
MADQEEEDLGMAMRMSMQHEPPEPKRSKPRENVVPVGSSEESPEVKNRRLQRELMAAAAEKRMMAAKSAAPACSASKVEKSVVGAKEKRSGGAGAEGQKGVDDCMGRNVNSGKELSPAEASQLFSMVFGCKVTKDILAQWTNQGIRFSTDPETSMGLVQHEGGPCGVLAAIQAFVLKYLLFVPEELNKFAPNMAQNLGYERSPKSECVASDNFSSLTEDGKLRALVRSMCEILFLCGSNRKAVIATLSILDFDIEGSEDSLKDEIIVRALEGVSIESSADLQKILRVNTYTTHSSVFQRLEAMIPVFRSRMGAMLFLISALLSRGLVIIICGFSIIKAFQTVE